MSKIWVATDIGNGSGSASIPVETSPEAFRAIGLNLDCGDKIIYPDGEKFRIMGIDVVNNIALQDEKGVWRFISPQTLDIYLKKAVVTIKKKEEEDVKR